MKKTTREITDPALLALIDSTTKIVETLPEGVSCMPGYAMHVVFRGQKLESKPEPEDD